MPQNLTVFRVFISSPSDLQSEHRVLEGALADLSIEFSGRSIGFIVVRWETDVVPGIANDTQAVINPQLEYDIYVGLLGGYFGTPTPRFGSGTEEEFEIAFSQYKESQSIRVLFYFRSASANIYDLDFAQLSKVKEFQKRIAQRGVLYGQFSSEERLLDRFKSHIRLLIDRQWDGIRWIDLGDIDHKDRRTAQPIQVTTTDQAPREESGDEVEGIWDLAVFITDASALLGQTLEALTVDASKFGESLSQASAEMDRDTTIQTAHHKKTVIDQQANSMTDFSASLAMHIPVFESSAAANLLGMQKLWALYQAGEAGDPENFRLAFDSYKDLVSSIQAFRPTMQTFRGILTNTPRLTKDFTVARKRVITQVDLFTSSATLFVSRSKVFIEEVTIHEDS